MSRRWLVLAAIGLSFAPASVMAQRAASRELVWPLPPDTPRVRWEGQLRGERDIGRKPSFMARLKRALVGGGSQELRLQRPHDVFSPDDEVFYVSDGGQGKVLKFDRSTRSVTVLGESGQGALRKPMGLGGDRAGKVFVADASAKRVVAFDGNGEFLRAYGGTQVLHNPVDVAVDDRTGQVYVADSYLHQVIVFDEATGRLIRRLGRNVGDLAGKQDRLQGVWDGSSHAPPPRADAGDSIPGHDAGFVTEPRDLVENRSSEPGEFRYPSFVAVARDGTLYVSDSMNFRVQAFDAEGGFLREIGHMGDVPGTFARPKGVGVDAQGHVYVIDAAFNNIQIFNPGGDLLLALGGLGNAAGRFWLPLGIHIDSANRIYVADRFNNRVQIFEYVGPETAGRRASGS